MKIETDAAMQKWGQDLADKLSWPFCIELVGDIGAGKTTLIKGLARGLGFGGEVSSPSFTLNNRYQLADNRVLSHYDFYRLNEAGVLAQELVEDLADPAVSVVVEWGATVDNVLPHNRQRIMIKYTADGGREVELK